LIRLFRHVAYARGQLADEVDQRVSSSSPTHDNHAGIIKPNQAANILAQIDPKHCNPHDPLLCLNRRRAYIA